LIVEAVEGPTLYPVACAPQAWASGAIYMVLEACLGIAVQAKQKKIVFDQPCLPKTIPFIDFTDLKVGEASVDVKLRRARDHVHVDVVEKRGDVEFLLV
jgi:glycogen debranching enzyme